MALPVRPPFEPMLAKLTRDMPPRRDLLSSRSGTASAACVFRDGDDLDLQSRNQKPLLRYFPEMREPLLEQLPGPGRARRRARDRDAEGPRLRRAAAAPAPGRVAREEARGGDPGVVRRVRPARARQGVAARRAVPRPARRPRDAAGEGEAAAVPHARDARAATPRSSGSTASKARASTASSPSRSAIRTSPGARTMLKVKHERTCDCVVAGYRMHKDGKASVRCCSASTTTTACCTTSASRAAMAAQAARPSCSRRCSRCARTRSKNHPWQDWADAVREAAGERAAHAGRHEPLERDQGHVVGAAAHRAGRARSSTRDCSTAASATTRASGAGATTRIPTTAPTRSSRRSRRPSCSRCSASERSRRRLRCPGADMSSIAAPVRVSSRTRYNRLVLFRQFGSGGSIRVPRWTRPRGRAAWAAAHVFSWSAPSPEGGERP